MAELSAEAAAAIAQAVVARARELGLIWTRRPGEVDDDTAGAVTVLLDGDTTVPISAISLIGAVTAGDRVMVDMVPPGATYIIGTLP